MNAEFNALAPLATRRAAVYEVLAALYLQPPSPALVAGLLELAGSAATGDLSTGSAGELLRRYAASYDGKLEVLQQEFNDLFAVPLGRYVTPYEAVYRDERVVGEDRVRGLLMGPSTLAVLQAYRENQFAVNPECPELPDHIGVELSFMSLLCGREPHLREAGDMPAVHLLWTRELRFLEDHLLRWVPDFAQRISENARTLFFQGIGQITEEFVRTDAGVLSEVLSSAGAPLSMS